MQRPRGRGVLVCLGSSKGAGWLEQGGGERIGEVAGQGLQGW